MRVTFPEAPGLEFDIDPQGRVEHGHCTRQNATHRCAHRFEPQAPSVSNAPTIYDAALRSKHWTRGPCPSGNDAFTVVEPRTETRRLSTARNAVMQQRAAVWTLKRTSSNLTRDRLTSEEAKLAEMERGLAGLESENGPQSSPAG